MVRPRGLSSLLLVLLAVFANVPESGRLLAVCCLVVLFPVVLQGGPPLVLRRKGRRENGSAEGVVSIEHIEAWRAAGEPVMVLDVRSPRSYEDSPHTAAGAARLVPSQSVTEQAGLRGVPKEAVLAAFYA